MKNIVIPRNDDRCALCRIAKANETGSHMVPNLLTAVAFSFDGNYKRGREIVEKYHIMVLIQTLCIMEEMSLPTR